VNQVKIVGEAILRGIHAHRRHDDPVAQGDAAQGQRGQQIHFRDFAVVVALALGLKRSRDRAFIEGSRHPAFIRERAVPWAEGRVINPARVILGHGFSP
jgi:hypothetical protein